MYNYVQLNAIIMINNKFVMILHMNGILIVMLVMNIIPNYNSFILFHYRGVYIPSGSGVLWSELWSVLWSESICI